MNSWAKSSIVSKYISDIALIPNRDLYYEYICMNYEVPFVVNSSRNTLYLLMEWYDMQQLLPVVAIIDIVCHNSDYVGSHELLSR